MKGNMLDESLSRLLDDRDFWEIQRRVTRFNLFEAIGGVTGELRHSNFLGYLLSPNRPHGLGADPLQLVLRSALEAMQPTTRPVSTLELLVADLDDAVVHRERDNIDLMIEVEELNLIVLIENKIRAKAGKGQLEGYRQLIDARYPKHRKLLIFLTPDGHAPDDPAYQAVSYVALADVFERMLATSHAGEESTLIVQHYIDMLRKNVVQDEHLKSLAGKLYERHKEALEFIFSVRPRAASLVDVIADQVRDCEGLIIDSSGSGYMRFSTEQWDEALSYRIDKASWSKTGRGLLFEVKSYANKPGRLNISLIIGPGDDGYRSALYTAAQARKELFVGLVKPMGRLWATIFSRDLLTAEAAVSMATDAQVTNLRLAWSDFQATTLPRLIETVLEIDDAIRTDS